MIFWSEIGRMNGSIMDASRGISKPRRHFPRPVAIYSETIGLRLPCNRNTDTDTDSHTGKASQGKAGKEGIPFNMT